MQSVHSSTSSNVFRYLLVIPYFYTLCPRTLCIFHWTRLFLISPFSFWKIYSFFLFSRLPLLPLSVSFWQYSFFSQFPFYGSVSSLLPSFFMYCVHYSSSSRFSLWRYSFPSSKFFFLWILHSFLILSILSNGDISSLPHSFIFTATVHLFLQVFPLVSPKFSLWRTSFPSSKFPLCRYLTPSFLTNGDIPCYISSHHSPAQCIMSPKLSSWSVMHICKGQMNILGGGGRHCLQETSAAWPGLLSTPGG